jgi:hypothetical protein
LTQTFRSTKTEDKKNDKNWLGHLGRTNCGQNMSVIKVDKESEELKSKKFPIFINVKIG